MTSYDPEKITYFAKTDARGKEVSFGIKAKDRQRHMYVVGKTGMGKSTLLENMAAQDIQNGEGMAFIDPHGSAAETLLEYVPEHRVKDVVYFAPFDLDNPVSFNVMEDVGQDKRHLVVSGLMSTFKKIWVDAWSARMEYILTNALLALIEYPDTTLLSVNRLFVDKNYRKKVVEYIKDPAVKAFWTDEFANYTDRFTAEALPAIQNKIGQFTGNPLIRNIIGQPHSSFDIRQLMDDKKILIMNLSKGLIGETNANLLGSMLTTRIYLAAMSRANLPVAEMKKMPNFYFYVDEFQSFANATFANILSEARKYHLNLIIAHQYIEQMEEDVRNAVFGNVGTTIAFRVGPFDAEVLETVFAPRFEAADLVNLGFAQIYLTLMIDGIGSQPFSASTLPPVELPQTSCREMVLDASRNNYANKREDVEKLVADLHTPEKKESPKKPYEKKPFNNAAPKPSQPAGAKSYVPVNKTASVKPYVPADKTIPAKPYVSTNKVVAPKSYVPANKVSTASSAAAPTPTKVKAPYKKPVVVDKTSKDLRQILAGMSQSKQADRETNSVSVTVDNKPKPIKTDKVTTKPANNPPQKKTEDKSDLKNTLADILKKIETPKVEPAVSESEPMPEFRPKSVIESSSKVVTPPVSLTPPRHYEPPVERSQVRKVVVENYRSGSDNSAQPAEKKPVKNVQAAPTKQVTKPSASTSNINTEKIKQMLRQNESERSPFN